MTLEDFIKREMKILEKLKVVLEQEFECIKKREYKSYKKLVKRKEELSDSLRTVRDQKEIFLPHKTLKDFMLESERQMHLTAEYLDLVKAVRELNESIELLTKMEQAFAQTFIGAVENSAVGEKTYSATGDYESPTEVDSTIINRSF